MTPGQLTLQNQQRRFRINTRFLRSITEAILRDHCGVEEYDLGVVLVGEARSREINESHLQHAGATDIITFDYTDGGSSKCNIHGELLICPAVAEIEANRFKTSWQSEIVRYIIHGILHLQGFDDLTPSDRKVMKVEENRIHRRLAKEHDFSRVEN